MLIDSDLFLIKEFSVRKYLEDFHLAGFFRPCADFSCGHNCKKDHSGYSGIEHIWIGLVFIDMAALPNKKALNFNCGKIWCDDKVTMSLDSGGYTYYYVKYTPEAKTKRIERINPKYYACKKCWESKKIMSCTHSYNLLNKVVFSDEFIKFIQKLPFDFRNRSDRESEIFLGETFFHLKGGIAKNWVGAQKMKVFKSFIDI